MAVPANQPQTEYYFVYKEDGDNPDCTEFRSFYTKEEALDYIERETDDGVSFTAIKGVKLNVTIKTSVHIEE